MLISLGKVFASSVLLAGILISLAAAPAAAGLNDLFGKKELDETERQETIERIESIQEKLKLLQDKLRVLERRKAAKEQAGKGADAAGTMSATPVQINWQPIDGTTTAPGDYGLYTYLLFKGDLADTAAVSDSSPLNSR